MTIPCTPTAETAQPDKRAVKDFLAHGSSQHLIWQRTSPSQHWSYREQGTPSYGTRGYRTFLAFSLGGVVMPVAPPEATRNVGLFFIAALKRAVDCKEEQV